MKVYVLTRIDRVDHYDEDDMYHYSADDRTTIGVFPTRQEAMSEGYCEKQWRGADDYDVEEFDL